MNFLKDRLISNIFIAVFFILPKVYSQIPVWKNYTAPTVNYNAAFEGKDIWIVSSGGVIKFDTITKQCVFFNPFNSGLTTLNSFSIVIDQIGNKWIGTGGGPNGSLEGIFPGNGLLKYNNGMWTTYNTSNSGLPNNTIRALTVDSTGTIWVGTYGGLAKFDGTSWVTYKRSNSNIPSDTITSLAVDNNGLKWIGTFKGVASFDDVNWVSFKRTNSNLPGDTIRTISVGADNIKWVGTSNGLGKYNDTLWTKYTVANSGLPLKNVTSVFPASDGKIWIGTYGSSTIMGGGLTVFDGTTWNSYKTSNSNIPENNVPIIISDGFGKKWLISERGQMHGDGVGMLSKINDSQINQFNNYSISNSGLLSNFCYHIERDSLGGLWFGGEKSGLTKFDGVNWVNYNSENSAIGDDDVLDIKFETTGNVWLIHDRGKMSYFNGSSFTSFNSPNGAADDPKCLYIDSLGRKWVGEAGTGIFIWNDTVWSNLNNLNSGLPSNYVYSITNDSSGVIWIGTTAGLVKADGATWTTYNTSNSGLLSNTINYIYIDSAQVKWLATQNGLVKFDGANWVVYRTNNSGLPNNVVYSVAKDILGNIWVTTYSGFAKFDGTNWTTFNYPIPANHAFKHVNFDLLGNTWIASMGRGVIRYTDSLVVTSFYDQQLLKNLVYQPYNFPNPFTKKTSIVASNLSHQSDVSISVYNQLGQVVNDFRYSVSFNDSEIIIDIEISNSFEAGAYFYEIITNDIVQFGKMLIIK